MAIRLERNRKPPRDVQIAKLILALLIGSRWLRNDATWHFSADRRRRERVPPEAAAPVSL